MTNKLSRRSILAAGAALAAAVPVVGFARDTGLTVDNQAAGRELQLHQSNTPEFEQVVRQKFPGLYEDPQFLAALPLFALLQYKAGPPVHAYSIEWNVASSDGNYSTVLFRHAKPGAKFHRTKKQRLLGKKQGKKLRSNTLVSGQTHVMKKGSVKLTTPSFTLSPKQYKKSPTDWHALISKNQKEPFQFLLKEASRNKEVHPRLDAVVYRDRKIVGVDKHGLGWRLTVRRNAEHDLAHSIFKEIQNGSSRDDIEKTLEAEAFKLREVKSGTRHDFYLQAKRRHSQFLLNHLGSVPFERFKKAVHRMAKIHKTKLKAA